jgi:hypothetical protein
MVNGSRRFRGDSSLHEGERFHIISLMYACGTTIWDTRDSDYAITAESLVTLLRHVQQEFPDRTLAGSVDYTPPPSYKITGSGTKYYASKTPEYDRVRSFISKFRDLLLGVQLKITTIVLLWVLCHWRMSSRCPLRTFYNWL